MSTEYELTQIEKRNMDDATYTPSDDALVLYEIPEGHNANPLYQVTLVLKGVNGSQNFELETSTIISYNMIRKRLSQLGAPVLALNDYIGGGDKIGVQQTSWMSGQQIWDTLYIFFPVAYNGNPVYCNGYAYVNMTSSSYYYLRAINFRRSSTSIVVDSIFAKTSILPTSVYTVTYSSSLQAKIFVTQIESSVGV